MMTIAPTLIELSTGQASLEFDIADLRGVVGILKQIVVDDGGSGVVRRVEATTYDKVFIDEYEFILMTDWDEPCLISRDDGGVSLLRRALELISQDSAPEVRAA